MISRRGAMAAAGALLAARQADAQYVQWPDWLGIYTGAARFHRSIPLEDIFPPPKNPGVDLDDRTPFGVQFAVRTVDGNAAVWLRIDAGLLQTAEDGETLRFNALVDGVALLNAADAHPAPRSAILTVRPNQLCNWLGADDDVRLPTERFDVKEVYSSKFINATVNYVILPIDFLNSRWEVTAGAGLSYNRMKLSGNQSYIRQPNPYAIYDDTSASFRADRKGLGYVVNGSMDFYWSPSVSTQFKMEFRNTPALRIPEQRMTYMTTRSRVRLSDVRVLKKHSIRYSGTVLSISIRFHI